VYRAVRKMEIEKGEVSEQELPSVACEEEFNQPINLNKKQDLFEIKREQPHKNLAAQNTTVINPLRLRSDSPVKVVEQVTEQKSVKQIPLVVLPPSAC